MATLLDSLTADLSFSDAARADADAFAAADAARTAAKAKSDASAAASGASHATVNAQAAEGTLYELGGGRFAIKIDGNVVYLSPVDPASVTLPDPAPGPAA